MKKVKIIVLAVMLAAAVLMLSGCVSGQASTDGVRKLSFKASNSYNDLKALNNTEVTINGYLATSSPADGSFIFLMNMPFQSCPFCVPNTNQLSNTIEVYPKKGQKFNFTAQAVKVTGRLEVAPSVTEYFEDPYGYTFNFRIADAEYTIIRDDELSAELAAWQKIAGSGIVNTIDSMYQYVDFTVNWPNYYFPSYENANGETEPGAFFSPYNAYQFLTMDESDLSYGYNREYFNAIEKALKNLNVDAAEQLIANVRKAETLARKAEQDLIDGNYTEELKYVEMFGTEDYVYTLNNGEAMRAEMDALYYEFANWLASWEV